MKAIIYHKNKTRLDDEKLENVDDISIYDSVIKVTYNNSKTQYENDIKVTKSIPKELINSIALYDF